MLQLLQIPITEEVTPAFSYSPNKSKKSLTKHLFFLIKKGIKALYQSSNKVLLQLRFQEVCVTGTDIILCDRFDRYNSILQSPFDI